VATITESEFCDHLRTEAAKYRCYAMSLGGDEDVHGMADDLVSAAELIALLRRELNTALQNSRSN